ncbi:MAG: hypothetical protein R2939_05295 [Kofleriaceae bacterium]
MRGRPDPLATSARSWLPFALGGGITAGVAPLLFLQVLYQERFYTANLLLAHRWMAIIPALVVGFYLLYLHKSARGQALGRLARAATIGVAWACFLFVAWSWTTNHLLMLDDGAWREVYAAGGLGYRGDGDLARWAMWLLASLPLFAAGSVYLAPPTARRVAAVLGAVGLGLALAAAAVVYAGLPASAQAAVAASPWRPVLLLAAALALGGWGALAWRPTAAWARALMTAAMALVLVAGALTREAVRAQVLAPLGPSVASAGGVVAFLLVAAAVVVALVAIARIVRSAAPEPDPE